jgi:hypothetical protein
LAQVVFKHDQSGRILIDKVSGTARSPNLADAMMILWAPMPEGLNGSLVFARVDLNTGLIVD